MLFSAWCSTIIQVLKLHASDFSLVVIGFTELTEDTHTVLCVICLGWNPRQGERKNLCSGKIGPCLVASFMLVVLSG